jgi:hypothetical protein
MIFNVKDFDAIGDGHHDDSNAFQRALDSMVPKMGVLKDAKGGGVLLVPEGNYYLTKTLWISHRVEIIGITGAEGENLINYTFFDNPDGTCDSKVNPGAVSRLMFKRGVTGIRVATGGPLTGNGDVGYADGAAGTILRNLTIMGAFNRNPKIEKPLELKTMWLDAPVSPTEFAHGISVKTKVIVDNCYIFNFKGNGIHIVALANQEVLPNAVTLNNGIDFDYSIFLSLRNTNHVGVKDGGVIGGQSIIVNNTDSNGEIKPNYDLKHQALGDLNRDNAYILRVENASE